ncbi:class I SAM-dependent methyltransferase [Nocardia lijiangensis]|uniref:class I SAM-dependent methyltransferase n=1 Tax=Nocardia lijiangensis TaxID=299618 RepID=UPI0012DBEC3E|nr:class I SAM-dependent methyltransferase [Nocardia lijiangensis]
MASEDAAGVGNPADLGDIQRRHWQSTYDANPSMYGEAPSAPAIHAAEIFAAAGARTILELGAGHGRDALHFARAGFTVHATDFSNAGLRQLRERADSEALEGLTAGIVDVRDPLPLPDESFDAVYAHMLLCMALSSEQIVALVREIHRVLRPGGIFFYTVRHTGDAHYGAGVDHGDDIFEQDGFAVHFFPRSLVDRLAEGWELRQVDDFEEGALPRRLWSVVQARR